MYTLQTFYIQVVPAGAIEPLSVGSVGTEESEEQKAINTANSVVIDSALSWFVSDKSAEDASPQDNNDAL